jgi:lysophospholipase L1-like esterase
VQIPKSNKFLYDAIHLNESGSILMGEIVSKKLAEAIESR